ncbi:MAG: ABC transporter ATP-binding protein [Candidatus Aminicenantes bacterium]|nr:ABC transporter ATP-binding protein [Candidatus Aminicenantes bacterium]
MDYALEVKALRKDYPGFTLRDVSFALPPGYIMGLIGPNGAGKTTIIKCILNIVRRTAGEVRVLGRDNLRHEREVKARVGFVLDEPPFYGYLKVGTIGSVIAPFYESWDRALFRRLCAEFELPLRKRVSALSRGMKMKLALAVALAHRAELILMDEPTSGLDPVFRRELLERLSRLIQDGRTSVLFSTHITSDLERVTDYITCLRAGELLFSTTRDEILEKWAIIKGGNELLTAETRGLIRGLQSGPHGFRALTDRAEEARRQLADKGAVVERGTLDDIVFFLARENGHA